jgi:hypothetical protein
MFGTQLDWNVFLLSSLMITTYDKLEIHSGPYCLYICGLYRYPRCAATFALVSTCYVQLNKRRVPSAVVLERGCADIPHDVIAVDLS